MFLACNLAALGIFQSLHLNFAMPSLLILQQNRAVLGYNLVVNSNSFCSANSARIVAITSS